MKFQCIHAEIGLCQACFKYEMEISDLKTAVRISRETLEYILNNEINALTREVVFDTLTELETIE